MHRALLLPFLVLAGCATTPPPAPVAKAPPPPPPGLGRILGQNAGAVTALLGAPSLERSEGPGRQLQFIRPPCVLDVFLYPTPGGTPAGATTVRTAAARKPDGSRMDPGTCLGLIIPVGR